jgi:hypothetical protein
VKPLECHGPIYFPCTRRYFLPFRMKHGTNLYKTWLPNMEVWGVATVSTNQKQRKATFLRRYKIYFSSHHKEYTGLGIIGLHFICTEQSVTREIGMNFLMASILRRVGSETKCSLPGKHKNLGGAEGTLIYRKGLQSQFIHCNISWKAQDFILRAKIRDGRHFSEQGAKPKLTF